MGATVSLYSALPQDGLPFSVGLQETTKKNRNEEDAGSSPRREPRRVPRDVSSLNVTGTP